MDEKENFGYLSSKKFNVGDIVEWTTWDSAEEKYNSNYGILINIENKVKSNRIISVSTVKPINEPSSEIELFTLSLKLVDSSNKNNNEID
jgi:hypothetical protein|tara:strand:- start:179 stop:448 length:270 start_codon:yes stop_codon:yes gene_type:complete